MSLLIGTDTFSAILNCKKFIILLFIFFHSFECHADNVFIVLIMLNMVFDIFQLYHRLHFLIVELFESRKYLDQITQPLHI